MQGLIDEIDPELDKFEFFGGEKEVLLGIPPDMIGLCCEIFCSLSVELVWVRDPHVPTATVCRRESALTNSASVRIRSRRVAQRPPLVWILSLPGPLAFARGEPGFDLRKRTSRYYLRGLAAQT